MPGHTEKVCCVACEGAVAASGADYKLSAESGHSAEDDAVQAEFANQRAYMERALESLRRQGSAAPPRARSSSYRLKCSR